jgi:hypothetical protein
MTILEPLRGYIARRGLAHFSLAQAAEALDRPRRPLLRMLDTLTAEGYLILVKDEPVRPGLGERGPARRNPTWRVNPKKNVAKRPRVQAPGGNTMRDKMWRLIRAQRRFTRSYLVRLVGCSAGSAEDFTALLEREGIIQRRGREGQENFYVLVKDPGVKRPRISERPLDEAQPPQLAHDDTAIPRGRAI